MNSSNLHRELNTAFEDAEKASEIIDDFKKQGFDTENKEDGSKVTEADKRAQEKIVEIISTEFSNDGFLGEEDKLTPNGEDRVWVIDPIDGTYNFSKGLNHYCVSIALKKNNEIVLGLVYSPESSLAKSYFAVKDEGAFTSTSDLDSATAITVSKQSCINDSLFFMSSFDIYEGQIEAELEVLKNFAEQGAFHRQHGSCALEMCHVAEGSVDFQLTPIVNEWDWSAAKLIVEEAGGQVRTRDSRFPNCIEVVCSNSLIQKQVEETIGDAFL